MAFVPKKHEVGDIVTCPSTGKKGLVTAVYTETVGNTRATRVCIDYTIH